jgi:hypothetical protein
LRLPSTVIACAIVGLRISNILAEEANKVLACIGQGTEKEQLSGDVNGGCTSSTLEAIVFGSFIFLIQEYHFNWSSSSVFAEKG